MGLAAALLTVPGMAQAQSDCPLVAAMLSKKPARLKGIGAVVNGKGTVDAAYNGKPDILRGASDCQIDAPATGFELRCTWDFEAGEDDKAAREFAALVKRVDACLPEKLTALPPKTYSEGEIAVMGAGMGASFEEYLRSVQTLSKNEGSFPLDAEGEDTLEISLSLDRDARDGGLTIYANLSRF